MLLYLRPFQNQTWKRSIYAAWDLWWRLASWSFMVLNLTMKTEPGPLCINWRTHFTCWTFPEENYKLLISDLLGYPCPIGEGGNGQRVDFNWTLFKITRQPFWKRYSWQSLGFCLQPQRTCTWNLKLKFQSKLELRCRNHAIQKPRNLIWPPGSHLENEVTENQ